MATAKKKTPARAKAPTAARSLAANAQAAHEARVARLRETGNAAIARVRALRARIEDDFLEIGAALVTLDDDELVAAVGYASFDALCEEALGISRAKARQLVAVTTRLAPALARELQQDRACALLALVDATPDDDTPDDVLAATLALPDGTSLVVRDAPTKQLWDAARAIRRDVAAREGRRATGHTVAPEDQARFGRIEKAVRARKSLAGAKLRLKAGRPGARVELDLALDDLPALLRALARFAT